MQGRGKRERKRERERGREGIANFKQTERRQGELCRAPIIQIVDEEAKKGRQTDRHFNTAVSLLLSSIASSSFPRREERLKFGPHEIFSRPPIPGFKPNSHYRQNTSQREDANLIEVALVYVPPAWHSLADSPGPGTPSSLRAASVLRFANVMQESARALRRRRRRRR